jgi:hypothetical protein
MQKLRSSFWVANLVDDLGHLMGCHDLAFHTSLMEEFTLELSAGNAYE